MGEIVKFLTGGTLGQPIWKSCNRAITSSTKFRSYLFYAYMIAVHKIFHLDQYFLLLDNKWLPHIYFWPRGPKQSSSLYGRIRHQGILGGANRPSFARKIWVSDETDFTCSWRFFQNAWHQVTSVSTTKLQTFTFNSTQKTCAWDPSPAHLALRRERIPGPVFANMRGK